MSRRDCSGFVGRMKIKLDQLMALAVTDDHASSAAELFLPSRLGSEKQIRPRRTPRKCRRRTPNWSTQHPIECSIP